DRIARVWDLAKRTQLHAFAGHTDAVWKCMFSPDTTRLLTIGNDGTAKIWNLAAGALVVSVEAGEEGWWCEFSPDGAYFVTASLDGNARVWDARTGAMLASHPFAGRGAHFSLDGQRLVVERDDGRLNVWRNP